MKHNLNFTWINSLLDQNFDVELHNMPSHTLRVKISKENRAVWRQFTLENLQEQTPLFIQHMIKPMIECFHNKYSI